MRKLLSMATVLSCLFILNSNAEAFKDVCVLGENGGPTSYIDGNSWSAVVSDNSIYMPEMTVKVKGFNDEKYTLSVTWEKQFETTYRNIYETDKKGRIKKDKKGNYVVLRTEPVTSSTFKWQPSKIVKNGIQIGNSNRSFYDKLFKALTGYNVDGSIDKISFNLGVQEYIAEFNESYPNYDGFGNISYYFKRENILSVFTIYSKINKRITGRALGSTYRYYPYINESSSEDTIMHDYQFAKNNSGVWKIQQVNSIYARDNSWSELTSCGSGLSDDNAKALSVKLDNAKAGLGL